MTKTALRYRDNLRSAPYHPDLCDELKARDIEYEIWGAWESGAGQHGNSARLIVWSEIMAEPKQGTPQVETPTPEAPAVGEGDKPTVTEVDKVLLADKQATRIKELEAALAKSQEKHKRAEEVIKSKVKAIEYLKSDNERLKETNVALTAKLTPQARAAAAMER